LDKDPASSQAREGLREARSHLSKQQRARALLEQGRLLIEQGDGRAAEGQLEEALGLDPDMEGLQEALDQARELAASQPPPEAPKDAGATVVAGAAPLPDEPEMGDGTRSRLKIPPPVVPSPPPKEESPSSRRGMWLGAAAAVVVIIAVAVMLLWHGEDTAPGVGGDQAVATAASPDKDADAATLAAQGEKFLQAGDLDQAEQAFRLAKSKDPDSGQASHGLERVARERQRLDQARLLVEQGENQARQGRFDEARSLWQQARELAPSYAPAQAKLGELEARKDQWQQEHARQEREDQARAALDRARAARGNGRWKEAVKEYEAYLAVFGNDAQVIEELDKTRGEQLNAGSGRLLVESRPDAEVYLDGEPRGKTPLNLESLVPGRHRVEVRAYGAARSKEVDVIAKQEAKLSFTLTGGSLAINSTPWAQVVLNGRPMGQTPIFKRGLVVGPHKLVITRPGYKDISQEIVLQHGKNTILSFQPQPQTQPE
jgi:tetratricopeptide (TPR) repeat protein